MATTRTDWHDSPAAEARTMLLAASVHLHVRHPSRLHWPVLLGWGAVLLGGIALWGLAALGLGRLTGWW